MHTPHRRRVAYSRDGAFMVAGFEGGYVHLISTEGDMQDIHVARNTASRITLVACSSTGDQVRAHTRQGPRDVNLWQRAVFGTRCDVDSGYQCIDRSPLK